MFSQYNQKALNQLIKRKNILLPVMIATDSGSLYFCNKQSKTPSNRINSSLKCYNGTLFSVQRNPSFSKIFLTVGDWQAKIWCEELKSSPIFWTKEYSMNLIYGCWNSACCSSFYLCRGDGVFDIWDITYRSERSLISMKV